MPSDPADMPTVPQVENPRGACGEHRAPPAEGPTGSVLTIRRETPASTASSAHTENVPGFVVVRELGHGGMGVVYLARQLSPCRDVALKVIRPGVLPDLQAQRLFQQEADTIGALNHSHIVHIYQADVCQGQPFLVLEYCEGGSLDELLRSQVPTPSEAATLVRVLAETMQVIHEADIIHRDLKPGNVLLTRHGIPKITDFGVARSANPSDSILGRVVGTPSYMAPEQAEGGRVGPLADVYSLGAILYECLTGRPPFKGSSEEETLHQVIHDEPIAVRTLARAVPRDLAVICQKCLEKDPRRRYGSALALADDLGRFLRGEPIRARPVWWVERALRWALLNKAAATLIAVSTFAVVIGLALAFYVTATLSDAWSKSERAERAAEMKHFFALRNQVVERAATRRMGWTWENLRDLAEVAKLPIAQDYQVEMRSDALTTMVASDLQEMAPLRAVAKPMCVTADFQGRCVAISEQGPIVDHEQGGPIRLVLVDPTNGRTLRSLDVAQVPIKDRPGSPDTLYVLAFSRDGRWLAGGTRSGWVHLWDLHQDTPSPARSWAGPGDAVAQVEFSTDGRLLYSGYERAGGIEGFHTEDGTRMPRQPGGETFALHPGEGWLAVTGIGPTPGFRYDAQLRRQEGPPFHLGSFPRFTPDGSGIISRDNAPMAILRETSTWEILHRFLPFEEATTMKASLTEVVLSPGGDLLLTANFFGAQCRLWEVITGRLVATINLPPGSFKCAFTSDARWLLVVTEEEVRRFAIRRSAIQVPFALGAGEVRAACWHPQGHSVAVGRRRQLLLVPHGRAGTWFPRLVTSTARYQEESSNHHLGFAGPNALVAGDMVPDQRHVESWDLTGQEPVVAFSEVTLPDTPSEQFRQMQTDVDGTVWVITQFLIRGIRNAEEVARWSDPDEMHKGRSGAVSLAVGPRWLVVGCREGTVRIFPRGLGVLQQRAAQQVSPHPLKRCVLSPDESLALLADEDRQLVLVSVPAGEIVFASERTADAIDALAWSQAGWIAVGCRDGRVELCRLMGSKLERYCVLRHARAVVGMEFSPDGNRLLVRCQGETGVRIWDLQRMLGELKTLGLGDGP